MACSGMLQLSAEGDLGSVPSCQATLVWVETGACTVTLRVDDSSSINFEL